MKKTTFWKSLFLLCALVVGSSSVRADDYELYSGAITEGDYVIYYNGYTLKNTISNNRFTNGTATPSEDKITNPSADVVWHIAADGNYWTIYNASVEKYAGGNASKNQGTLLSSVTDYAKWTITGNSAYEFENLGRATGTSDKNNKWLRNNGNSGWACYSTSTGGAVSLYKKVEESGEATTVTIDDSEITNTNKFVSTSAGSFSASVIYGSPASAVPGAVVTWSSETESVATINETTGVVTLVGAGTTKIVASYAGVKNEYKSSFAEYVLTVTDEDPTILYEEKTSFGSGETSGTLGTLITYASNLGGAATAPAIYNSGIRLYQINGSNDYGGYVTMTAPSGYKITGFAITSTNTYATTVDYTVDGSTKVGDGEALAKSSEYAKDGLFNSSVSVFNLGTTKDNRLEIASIRVYYTPVVPVTISAAEYATYFNATQALNFSKPHIKAYTATDMGSYVKLNEISSGQVPANTPVVLYKEGADGTAIDVPVIASAEPVDDNDLAVVTTEGGMEGVANMFVLSKPAGKEVGFYAWKVGAILNKGKVFLQGEATSARDFLGFNEGNTTAIDNVVVKTVDANAPMYNLAGQRVNKSYKGVVIVNGKKMLNK